jgi:hypothetical protein
MSDSREAVEARARAFLNPKWRPGLGNGREIIELLADFSLAENAEQARMVKVCENAFQLQEAFSIEGRAGQFNGLQIAKAWLELEKRAEAAEAEVVKLNKEIEWWRDHALVINDEAGEMRAGRRKLERRKIR